MADIISLNEKLHQQKNKQGSIIKKRKILAVQKVFRCIRCAFKCEKCGTNIEFGKKPQPVTTDTVKVPYHFCDSCREEYIDYIHLLKGEKNPENYWHNNSWAELWKRWIDYQGSLDNYLKSNEFKQLLLELKEIRSDDEEV